MPIVSDLGHIIRYQVDCGLLSFLDANDIRTSKDRGVHRWKVGDLIVVAGSTHLHKCSRHLLGRHIANFDCFSYSYSDLHPYLKVGRYCSIAKNVTTMGPKHAMEYTTSSEILYNSSGIFADTFAEFGNPDWTYYPNRQPSGGRVENDVWIGQDVLLRPDVVLGTGSVIAAGSVVTKHVGPYEIVGGNPARLIRMRFDEKVVRLLLESEWWDYAIPALPHAPWNDPEKLCAYLRDHRERGDIHRFVSDLGDFRTIAAAIGS